MEMSMNPDDLPGAPPSGSGSALQPPAAASASIPSAWISVEDRMPEPDTGEVLVWLTGGRCAFDEWHMYHEDPLGLSTTYTMEMGLMWRDYDFDEVTHWMPLPEPPCARDRDPEGANPEGMSAVGIEPGGEATRPQE
jgi:hypothetical protein